MTFEVEVGAYDRFMGRYSRPLAILFADWSGVHPPGRALDVGAGTGALTEVLVDRLGVENVSAIDPSQFFVDGLRQTWPTLDVRAGVAEHLPHPDDDVDHAMAQLVVHFMPDQVAGLREMARVTHAGGTVAACVWNLAGPDNPLSIFWQAAHEVDPQVDDQSGVVGARAGELAQLFQRAGLSAVEDTGLFFSVRHESFEQWWAPFSSGAGPVRTFLAGLDDAGRTRLRERCRELAPDAPFDLEVTAWAARGRA